jgi:ssDNA-binding Zn-finger/Zn-ribbon topoisomerase 1
MLSHVFLHRKLSNAFQTLPVFDYTGGLSSYQELLTNRMTKILDERLLDFCDNDKSTAKTLQGIIRKKKRFPKDEFGKLKKAFPCIVAGIRDYAEYIPLEPGIFDVVIIDEASQVSIAQAFPALLRAKKVVVLGDKKQFSNVKTAQARTDTNTEYLNRLDTNFRKNISAGPAELERLTKFNIKTSILEFFEFIANFNIMLRKHFRGYRELISYSSKHFYEGDLQAIRIRGKSIEDTIKFSLREHDGKQELAKNTNSLECEFILNELRQLKIEGNHCSVGIITPHTNQQKLIASAVSNDLDRDYFYESLKLKIMTFDTCQGEERDIIFYSMVASPLEDKLWGVFIKDLDSVNLEEGGQIKAQRLNVGFSRTKECMHFVLSKPLEEFKGAIGQALRHYSAILRDACQLPDTTDVDRRSPMEAKVLEWIKNTAFFQKNSDGIELKAQFPIGEYLKQLDPRYDHPAYRVDFLFLYRDGENRQHSIIIEYDGFNEHFGHFTQNADVDVFNYDSYYTAAHVEREKVLEGYGYKFLRINRFNLGEDPVSTLNERLLDLTRPKPKLTFAKVVHRLVESQETGRAKECPRCGNLLAIDAFADSSLTTGVGRICNECKARSRSRTGPARKMKAQTSTTQDTARKDCPKCGSPMVRRTGRYGAFYGCSTYPKCRGTRRI